MARQAPMLLALGLLLVGSFPAFMYLKARQDRRAARNWITVPCVVVSNRFVKVSQTGRTKLELAYRYEYDGRHHTSDELDLSPGRSGGSDSAWEQGLSGKLPVGAETVCYVDAGNPARAVLDRERIPVKWWVGLPFVLGGLAVCVILWSGRLLERMLDLRSQQTIRGRTNAALPGADHNSTAFWHYRSTT